MKKFFIFIFLVLIAGFFYFFWFLEKKIPFEKASSSNLRVEVEIIEGEGSTEVGKKLKKKGLIKNKYFFYYYVWRTKTSKKIQAGKYEFSPNMTLEEIVEVLIGGKIKQEIVKLTIPEGYTNKKIIETLKEKKPTIADQFEQLASCRCFNKTDCECDFFSEKYSFVKEIPTGVDLEGYLFPDTYFIYEEDTGKTLIEKFLRNFEKKINNEILEKIKKQNKTLHEVITMASIVEKEVNEYEDRRLVAGIFWKRIKEEMPLQSCATLAYVTGENKEKYYQEDINFSSPYNTYLNLGLPPGPISNPGLESIEATVWPKESDYYFFLSDPQTGKTIFSKNSQEHSENKAKAGL